MCGRYQMQLSPRRAAMLLRAEEGERLAEAGGETWNAAPGQQLPLLHLGADGHRVLDAAEWGFVGVGPDGRARPFVNARVETIGTRRSFRDAARRGRVLVPATGFYEWSGSRGDKTPYSIRVSDEELFLMAGIAQEVEDVDGRIGLRFAVLTTQPNELTSQIHDRMPVILEGELADAWLETPPERAEPLLKAVQASFPADRMEAWPVARDVNRVANDGPQLVARAEPEAATQGPPDQPSLFDASDRDASS